VYFLCYRIKNCRRNINWTNPTGGLVMEADEFVQGKPISDHQLAANVLELRYHCGPHEALVIAEVFEEPEMLLARRLHQRWEREQHEFLELMENSA
jgi:hypothetical protein